jgi:Fungal specific transcription factor domain/Fungal Zn(2)-Cys(6) binuclear cluster domain
MVGQPRSKGCRICVQRRVRCDLTRPICLRCRKGNRPCPGYASDIQFQDETERLHEKFGRNRSKDDDDKNLQNFATPTDNIPTSSDSSSQPTPEPTPFTASPSSSKTDWALVTSLDRPEDIWSQLNLEWNEHTAMPTRPFSSSDSFFECSTYCPDAQQRQLFSLFTSSMAPANQQTPQIFRKHGNWLNQLSAMQGLDPLLDNTFRAVSLAHLSLVNHNPNLMHESRKLYGRSLGLLSKALSDPYQGRSSETLSATILLSFYEMFSSNHETSMGYDAWVKHAGGAGALMQARGPKAHRHGLDRSMFLAYRNALVIEAFESGRSCFLDEPEWRNLAAEIHEEVHYTLPKGGEKEILYRSEDFFNELIRLPGVLSDARHLAALTRAVGGNRRQAIDGIVSRTKKHRAKLTMLYLSLDNALRNIQQERKEYPSISQDPLFPISYSYPNIFTASHYVGYWNVLMIMNVIPITFDADTTTHQGYIAENVQAGRHVCRSVEYMSTSSFLGPFFITFALRTSMYALQTDEEKQWVVKKLLEIGEKLGMAKQITGPDRGLSSALRRGMEELDRIEEVTT